MAAGNNQAIRIALCQHDFLVGDINGNLSKIQSKLGELKTVGVDLAVFPELALTGYPPEDLLLKPHFVENASCALQKLASDVKDIIVVVGFPELSGALYNSAAVLANGKLVSVYRKHCLPNYAVFDERRYFESGDKALVLDLGDAKVGITICEDIWYRDGPAQWATTDGGAEIILNLSASPYHRSKGISRERMFVTRCIEHGCYLVFCNTIGGQDELVFDGHSLVIDPKGNILARGKQFEEDLIIVDINSRIATSTRQHGKRSQQQVMNTTDRVRTVTIQRHAKTRPAIEQQQLRQPLDEEAEIYQALQLGTKDYFHKNGFRHAVLGLSGGIDSALSLAIAVDALGAISLSAVMMPSRYTASHNQDDARELASRLKVEFLEIPIDTLFMSYLKALDQQFKGTRLNVAEENLQARIRGNLLMALSNKFNWLVITTGNKSEMSVGYATLYGDMAGGFSILKDVPKTLVYRLVNWRNRECEIIPKRMIDKPPSAELREGQLDTDNLPPYSDLDRIIQAYVEDDCQIDEIEKLGFEQGLICRVINMVDRAEYKRRQAAPGVRISTRAFGKDRRLPITNHYRPV